MVRSLFMRKAHDIIAALYDAVLLSINVGSLEKNRQDNDANAHGYLPSSRRALDLAPPVRMFEADSNLRTLPIKDF